MNRILLTAGLALVALALTLLAPGAQPAQAEGELWITDYAAGMKQAKETGQPVFLVFR